jgi:uncharacterized protein
MTALINPNQAGIGLRAPHYRDLQALTIADKPSISFLEIHNENFFGLGGQPWAYLDWFRDHYPISAHGVGLSLASADALNRTHLDKLKKLVDRLEPALISEHLCWVGVEGEYSNDLLPVPYTAEALAHVASRISEVQDYLQRAILIENVSSYLTFRQSTMSEWDFVAELSRVSGCKILLDVNNIYVNSVNHQFDAIQYLDAIQVGSVGEIHLAGFQDTGEILIDTHGARVSDEVWALYRHVLNRFGQVPTLVEWDSDIPPLTVLINEATKATSMLNAQSQAHAN